jgi:hypothetical protein
MHILSSSKPLGWRSAFEAGRPKGSGCGITEIIAFIFEGRGVPARLNSWTTICCVSIVGDTVVYLESTDK